MEPEATTAPADEGTVLQPPSHETMVEKIMADLRHPTNLDITTRIAHLETAIHGFGTALLGLLRKWPE